MFELFGLFNLILLSHLIVSVLSLVDFVNFIISYDLLFLASDQGLSTWTSYLKNMQV